MKFPPRTCPTCGITFTPDTHTQRYDKYECRPKPYNNPVTRRRYWDRKKRSKIGKYAGL